MKNKKALFIDRNGVINSDIGYVYEQNNFILRKKYLILLDIIRNENFK